MGENGLSGNADHEKRGVLHYLGPPGTYSHQVALELVSRIASDGHPHPPQLQPCTNIKNTIQEAHDRTSTTKQRSWALLPYENNSNGPVSDSYDILFSLNPGVQIVEEYFLPVSHSLLCSRAVHHKLSGGVKGGSVDLKQIDIVSSHPQALGQCSTFLSTSLRQDTKQVQTSSTGEAARALRDEDSSSLLKACISSRICAHADVYDLVVLQDKIQNSGKNVTRFLLLEVGAKSGKAKMNSSAKQMRMMLRLETTGASESLTILMAAISSNSDDTVQCHIRCIERRAKKDAVDAIEDENKSVAQGHWPFVYLIEVEARRGAEAVNQSVESEDVLGRLETLYTHTLTRMQTERHSGLTCLGIWSVRQGE